ncbi:MAG: ATP synthase F1 subunit delta [Fimbriimonadaceae bacterium]|nr:ATP synthase subunit delta [Fimbriimonadaceae bacterium]MCC6352168.1 ATP synthase F1 subunit delta [Fimbriimonadaceae bacterium]MCL4284056.1 ATP synthase F1 subunit delta [Fimbriimonadaceae bacterium]QOJ12872.1 MAG: ATP synthase F1 subunit delta [Chthonomonadaceae bacterium]
MGDTRVARRYAKALYRAAKSQGIVESVEADLAGVVGIIERDPGFGEFLVSPRIAREHKLPVLERAFSDRVTALTMHALRLMLQKRREDLVPDVYKAFVAIRREHGAVLYAHIASSIELTEKQRSALLTKLEKGSGKKVEAEFSVDSNLLGGIRVAYGNFVLDGSVRGSLRRMRDTLKYELLKQA